MPPGCSSKAGAVPAMQCPEPVFAEPSAAIPDPSALSWSVPSRRDLLSDFRDLDFVVSNPPYVAFSEADKVQRSVSSSSPDGRVRRREGPDVIRPLIEQAHDALKTGGWLALEIGYSMRDVVVNLLSPTMWDDIRVVPDLQGIPRVVVARRTMSDHNPV